MQNYTQLYEYDKLGNILSMQSQNAWQGIIITQRTMQIIT